VPSRAWVEVVMRGAPALAVPQVVAVVSAGEAVVVPVEVVVAGAAAAAAVAGAGKKAVFISVLFA